MSDEYLVAMYDVAMGSLKDEGVLETPKGIEFLELWKTFAKLTNSELYGKTR